MATVLPRPDNPWEALAPAIDKISGAIGEALEKKAQKTDLSTITRLRQEGNFDPDNLTSEQALGLATQMKSEYYRNLLTHKGFSGQGTSLYGKDAQGNYVKKANLPANAQLEKTDPAELEVMRQQGRENIEDKRSSRMFELQSQRDAAAEQRQMQTTERMMAMLGLKADQKTPNEIELAQRAAKGDKDAQATMQALTDYRAQAAGQKARATQESKRQDFDTDTVDYLARTYIKTGTMPPMGMGGTEARKAVYKRASEIANSTGTTPEELADTQAARKSLSSALTELEKRKANILAFSNTTEKNLAVAEELSGEVGRTGIPVVNRWINAGKRSLTGDPSLAKFDASIRTAVNEFAKVTSSATGGGVTSDQARKEVEDMLNAAQTPEQVKEVIGLLRREMENRRAGFDEEEKSLKASMAGSGTLKPHNMQAGETQTVNGFTYVKGEDGKWHKQQ